jgi:HTH-type transcriptional regulator / antitoxin HigA
LENDMAGLAIEFKEAAYRRLLARTLPRVIRTEEENARVLAELERLDTLSRPLTPEETEVAELMTLLVRQFERERYPIGRATPAEALRELMDERGVRQRDLIPLLGSRGIVSEVVNGKPAISKMQARKLADFFRVPVDLFI